MLNCGLAHWKALVKVAAYENTREGVSLAREGGTWATVTETEKAIELHISTDDGATWRSRHRLVPGDITRLGRVVALTQGRAGVAYFGYGPDYNTTVLTGGRAKSRRARSWTRAVCRTTSIPWT